MSKDRAQWKLAGAFLAVILVLVVVVIGIVVVGGIGLLALAGSADSGPTGPGSDVSNVSMVAADASPPDATHSLDVVWNARAQSEVDPDPSDFSAYNANEGEKFLVVRMEITNSGDTDVELTQRLFKAEADGVRYDTQSLFGSGNSISDVTLSPGATYSGWVAFSIPSGTTDAELTVSQEAYYRENVTVAFDRNPEMPINMSD